METLLAETIVNQQSQRFGADASIPVRPSYPISSFNFVLADFDVALAAKEVADATNNLFSLFKFDGPCAVVIEDGSDNLEAFLDTLVRRPTSARSHLWVAGVFVECLCITFAPRTKY